MGERPLLARSELEIAQVVWQRGRATVREVLEALPEDRGLDFKTVQTYLRRLEEKGYLTSTQSGRAKVYRSRVRPRTVIRELVSDFMDRVFHGDPIPFVQNIIQEQKMSAEDIAKLRQLLDDREPGDD